MTLYVEYDPEATQGNRLSPLVIAEIRVIAPSVVVDGSIKTPKLADLAVTTSKIADDAVTTDKIANSGVETANLKDAAVVTSKMADGSVNKAKVGTGVVTGSNTDGSPASFDIVVLTALEYAAIGSPVAGTFYFIKA